MSKNENEKSFIKNRKFVTIKKKYGKVTEKIIFNLLPYFF